MIMMISITEQKHKTYFFLTPKSSRLIPYHIMHTIHVKIYPIVKESLEPIFSQRGRFARLLNDPIASEHFFAFGTKDVPSPTSTFHTPYLESVIAPRSPGFFSQKKYLETKIGAVNLPTAARISLLLDSFCGESYKNIF